jgi:hypothetical protein
MTRSEFDHHAPPSPLGRFALRGGLLLSGVLLVGAVGRVGPWNDAVPPEPTLAPANGFEIKQKLDVAEGELAVKNLQLDRLTEIVEYSSKYQVPADLAAAIYDNALNAGIHPSIGFRLVQVESNFKLTAKSSQGAMGYTQIQPATARFYEPGLKDEDLFERDTNLRLGFKFLKDQLNQYNQDMNLALLAYNRGPSRVNAILARGGNPGNGYDKAILDHLHSAGRGRR